MDSIRWSWHTGDGLTMFAQGWLPEGPPRALVALVHGLGEHSGRYTHVGTALARSGFALFGFDLRGHGQSAGPRGHTPSYEALLGDIDAFLTEVAKRFHTRPHFLYGHSLGGNLVLNYALRRRPTLAGVVATGPALRLSFEPPPAKVALARLMNRLFPAFTQASGLEVDALSHDPEVVRAYRADPLVHDRISARLFLGFFEAGRWALAHANEFPVPLLLMHGGADRICSPDGSREFAAHVTGDCLLKIWDGLYHEVHNEPQKDEVLGVLIAWLERHATAPVTA
jgi:alpha-beta hydrolase superfamily lysophospholipase